MSKRKYLKESIKLGDKELSVETGKIAKQANGAVIIRYGDTMILVAAVSADSAKEGLDFFPLTVEYRESSYAAGRIPGNYFRREGRPNEKEVLTCRLIDRPIRPLFPDGYRFETQIIGSVLSADADNDPDVIAITGASCALYLSNIPFETPIAGVRIGLIEGRYIVNPTYDERRESALNLIVAGTEEAIVMVEAEAHEVSEQIMLEAMMLAHKEIKRLCLWQKELFKALEIKKRAFEPSKLDEDFTGEIEKKYSDKLRSALDTTGKDKLTSYAAVDELKKEVVESYPAEDAEKRAMAGKVFGQFERKDFPRRYARQSPPSRRTQIFGNPPDFVRSRLAAANTRFGTVHARRNTGNCYVNFGNEDGRAVYGRSGKRRTQTPVYAPLQFPAVFSRRNRTFRRYEPPRNRSRQFSPPRTGIGSAR